VELQEKVAVITGGGQGLGAGLCRRFAAEGARVVVVDLDEANAREIAKEVGGLGLSADVGVEADVQRVVARATQEFGQVDVWFSNAGVGSTNDAFADDAAWARDWQVHVMAHVYATRAVLPQMLERGDGYLVATASGNALTANPWSMTYSVTKHAALAACEWLAINHRPNGIKVSCLVPYSMRTPMLLGQSADSSTARFAQDNTAMDVEEVAQVVVDAMRAESFLILSHPEVVDHFRRKAADYDEWIAAMSRMKARIDASTRN